MSNEQQEQVKCVSGQTHSFFQKQSPAALFGSKARTSARAWRLSPACPGGHRLPSAVGKLQLASDARRASGEALRTLAQRAVRARLRSFSSRP